MPIKSIKHHLKCLLKGFRTYLGEWLKRNFFHKEDIILKAISLFIAEMEESDLFQDEMEYTYRILETFQNRGIQLRHMQLVYGRKFSTYTKISKQEFLNGVPNLVQLLIK